MVMIPVRVFTVTPVLPEPLKPLEELAYNYWWSWDADGRELFSQIDKQLWDEVHHNPVLLLYRVPQERWEELAKRMDFVNYVQYVHSKFRQYMERETWYDRQGYPKDLLIAYFCAEYGIHESFPNYSGGLGVLAADHLKTASDLGIPLVGVGLLYQQGYFNQVLAPNGWQNEEYYDNDFSVMPLRQVRGPDGQPVKIQVAYPEAIVYAEIWEVAVGRVKLYLLSTNLPENKIPEYRDITDQLYGGNIETRIQQEIMLGIGGYRALRALGLQPTVLHLNEGHAAFAALEHTRTLQQQFHCSFEVAMELCRSNTVFTTHTPVPAGHDRFSPELVDKYFAAYYQELGLDQKHFLALGREEEQDPSEDFCMTVLALKMAGWKNGVSRLHSEIARKMWHHLWKDFPLDEVPIDYVRNGVHTLSWVSREMASLFDRYLTPRWREEPWEQEAWQNVFLIPSEELWRVHERRRERLILFARRKLRQMLERRSVPTEQLNQIAAYLHPDVLTIGFARRFATYKRPTLLFQDMERLKKLLTNPERPVQILLAGKAHPHDVPAKEMIREIVQKVKQYGLERYVVFLENYDIEIARLLVKGCDVWLNTPRRPLEASGTSGMKAVLNGAIHVSTLDGWWDEAYNGENGFAIGQRQEFASIEEQDFAEGEALFDLLEQEVIPMFYDRGLSRYPEGWVERMKVAIYTLAAPYSSAQMLHQYLQRKYLPAYQEYKVRSGNNAEQARAYVEWKRRVMAHWNEVRILNVVIDASDTIRVGQEITVSAYVDLGALSPDDVRVEAYCGKVDKHGAIVAGEASLLKVEDKADSTIYLFRGQYQCRYSGIQGCTVRIIPWHPRMITIADLYRCIWASQ